MFREYLDMPVYLEDPGLLLEVFVLVRLGVGEVVDLDAVLVDFIQNLQPQHGSIYCTAMCCSTLKVMWSVVKTDRPHFLCVCERESPTLRLSLSLSLRVSVSALAMTGTTLTLLWMAFMNCTSSGFRLHRQKKTDRRRQTDKETREGGGRKTGAQKERWT